MDDQSGSASAGWHGDGFDCDFVLVSRQVVFGFVKGKSRELGTGQGSEDTIGSSQVVRLRSF